MKKILIADDEKDFVLMLEQRLRSRGYNVIVAYDGAEAVLKARSEKPDLVILDIVMPKMDGTAAARKIKEATETKGVPVIFLTALKTKEDQTKLGSEGGNITFAKPFDPKELIGKVDELMGEIPKEPAAPKEEPMKVMVRFLIVDPSAVMRKMMIDTIFQGRSFNAANTQIIQAGNGEEGLTMFRNENPHIVLANITLPKLSGEEMVKEIRKNNTQIPILMIATAGSEKAVEPLVASGVATDYVIKPISAGTIEEKMLQAFQNLKQKSGDH